MDANAKAVGLLCAAWLGAAAPAAAQNVPAPDHPRQVDPKGCAPGERLQEPGNRANGETPKSTTGENLSDKLARTEGVLCPPNVDPDIRQPAPQGGKMPVIPPPGSPGGDQSVRPK